MRKNLKKWHLTKSAVKGMLGAGMMSGGMLAYNSFNNLKEDEDDLKWMSEIMASGKAKLGQGEVSLSTI